MDIGDASVPRIEDIDVPAPAADEIQIAVRSIGINRAEVMFRNHAYLQEATFPTRLGYEAAGVVEAVGADVTGFAKGDADCRSSPRPISPAGALTARSPTYRHAWRWNSPTVRPSRKRPLCGCSTSCPGARSSIRRSSVQATS